MWWKEILALKEFVNGLHITFAPSVLNLARGVNFQEKFDQNSLDCSRSTAFH